MKKSIKLLQLIVFTSIVTFLWSCNDSKTYAELLTDETHYVNSFLADHCVENEIPTDTIFKTVEEYGDKAPYYRIDEEGNLYMQVISVGPKERDGLIGGMAEYDDLVYFRFTRYNLAFYKDGKLGNGEGNNGVLGGNYSFRFGNYDLNSSYSFGSGIQAPLEYLPFDSSVNIIIKSQFGMPSEMSYVVPYLYENVRYYRPTI